MPTWSEPDLSNDRTAAASTMRLTSPPMVYPGVCAASIYDPVGPSHAMELISST